MTERPGDGAPADPPADAQQGPSAAPPNDVPPDVAARLVQALDRAPSAFVTLIDADMRSRWLSRSATWITGTDPDSRPGRDALERIHPDDVERLAHGLAQLRAADRPAGGAGVPVLEPLRYRIRRPDDTWITVEAFVLNLLDDPVVEGLVVVGRPVGGELDGVGHVVDLLTADAPLPQVLAACANLVPHYLGPAAVVALVDDEPVVGVRSGSPAELLAVDDRWWRPVAAGPPGPHACRLRRVPGRPHRAGPDGGLPVGVDPAADRSVDRRRARVRDRLGPYRGRAQRGHRARPSPGHAPGHVGDR